LSSNGAANCPNVAAHARFRRCGKSDHAAAQGLFCSGEAALPHFYDCERTYVGSFAA